MVSEDAYAVLIEAKNRLLVGQPISLAWAVEYGDQLHDAWVNCEAPRLLLDIVAFVAPREVVADTLLDIATMALPAIRLPRQAAKAVQIARRVIRNDASVEELNDALAAASRSNRPGSSRDPSECALRAIMAAGSFVVRDERAHSPDDRTVTRVRYVQEVEAQAATALGDTDETMATMVEIVRAHMPTLTLADIVRATEPKQ